MRSKVDLMTIRELGQRRNLRHRKNEKITTKRHMTDIIDEPTKAPETASSGL
jgi:hypothetical protein